MATKVTAAQRKHATASLATLHTDKMNAIRKEFSDKPENKFAQVPMQILPNVGEAIRALMGMETRATLKMSREEIAQHVDAQRHGYFNFNPLHYVNPTNQDAMNAAQAINDQISQRHREEVDGRLALLNNAYRSACDVAVLCESGDELLRILQEFEQREF